MRKIANGITALGLLLLGGLAETASAGPAAPAKPSPRPPAKQATAVKRGPAKPAAQAAPPATPWKRPDGLHWDYWYTVTVGQNIHYAYYNDKIEFKEGKIVFQNKFWKLEEGYLNEEQLGSVAVANADLTPLFFNFHSAYRNTETKIDGNVRDTKTLLVKVRKGNSDLPLIQRALPPRSFFSVFFPLWVSFRFPLLKPGRFHSFSTILEDNLELGFQPVGGQFRIEPSNPTSQKTATRRLSVNYRDLRSTWYVDDQGAAVRIEIPAQRTVIERVSQGVAQSFLDE